MQQRQHRQALSCLGWAPKLSVQLSQAVRPDADPSKSAPCNGLKILLHIAGTCFDAATEYGAQGVAARIGGDLLPNATLVQVLRKEQCAAACAAVQACAFWSFSEEELQCRLQKGVTGASIDPMALLGYASGELQRVPEPASEWAGLVGSAACCLCCRGGGRGQAGTAVLPPVRLVCACLSQHYAALQHQNACPSLPLSRHPLSLLVPPS